MKWLCRKALWFEYKGNAVLQEMETLLWDPLDPSQSICKNYTFLVHKNKMEKPLGCKTTWGYDQSNLLALASDE